jgi:hypothetical protein
MMIVPMLPTSLPLEQAHDGRHPQHALVARYRDALASGSFLALSHYSVGDTLSDPTREVTTKIYTATPNPPTDRSRGVAFIGLWGADDPTLADSEGSRLGYAAVARKP